MWMTGFIGRLALGARGFMLFSVILRSWVSTVRPVCVGSTSKGVRYSTTSRVKLSTPTNDGLLVPDAALAEVVALIRRFHDAVESFADPERFEWSDRGGDPCGPHEIVCHNDLAPWNLVHTPDGRWVFIDWDFAAPGRRSWDLAFALLSMVPLMPQSDLTRQRTAERIALFRSAYGPDAFPDEVLAVVAERCAREADLIDRLGAAGEPPYDRLLREGHSEIWHAAEAHVVGQTPDWQAALNALG